MSKNMIVDAVNLVCTNYSDEFEVNKNIQLVSQACEQIITKNFRWPGIEKLSNCHFRLNEGGSLLSTHYPVTMEILLESKGSDISKVLVKGHLFGLGPIQKSHLKKQIHIIRNELNNFDFSGLQQAAEKKLLNKEMYCQVCNKVWKNGGIYCPDDGTLLAAKCISCFQFIKQDDLFCSYCGAKVI